MYPGESNASQRQRGAITGAKPGLCMHASALAAYSERDLLRAFVTVRERNKLTAVKYVYQALRDNNPRVRNARARSAVKVVAPVDDAQLISAIWEKVGHDAMTACREILRLSREVVTLRAELAKYAK
jgi:hypothetical protein